MAIAVEAVTSNNTGTGTATSISVAEPTYGAQSTDDILVVSIGVNNVPGITAPSGFSQRQESNVAASSQGVVFSGRRSDTGAGPWTFSTTDASARRLSYVCQRLSGCDVTSASSHYDTGSAAALSTGTAVTFTGITLAGSGELLIASIATIGNAGAVMTATPPTTPNAFVEDGDQSTTATGTNGAVESSHYLGFASGATGSLTGATISSSQNSHALLVAIKASSGPPPPLPPLSKPAGRIRLVTWHARRRFTQAIWSTVAVPPSAVPIAVAQASETETAQAITVIGGSQFPATIGGIHPESNNRLGPFIDGNGNLYTVTELTVADPRPCMRKSSDGGKTWVEVDAANRPAHDDLESLWIEQRGTVLYLLHQRSGTMRVSHNTFNTSDAGSSPDTWQTKDEVVHLPGTAPGNQAVSLAIRSNGDLLAFYRTDPVSGFQRLAWRKKPSGGSWSAETQVDTTASTNFTQVAVVRGASDKIHIFYKDDTNSNVLHKSLTSADSLSASSVVNDNTTTTDDQMMATPPVYVDVAGTERVYAAWKRLSNGFLVGAAIDNDGTPAAEESVSDVAVWEDPAAVISEQSVATLAADPVSGKIHALYADNATHDLWRNVRNGSWGTPAEVLDAVEVQYLSAQVFTHGSQGAGKRVLGIIFDDNPTGATDAGVPKYTQVVLGPAPIGQASETEQAQAVARLKTRAAAQAVETETALAVTVVKVRAAGQATEAEAAQAISRVKTRAVSQVIETEAGQAVAARKVVAVGQAVEAEAGQAVAVVKAAQVVLSAPVPYNMVARLGVITVGQATETEQGQSVTKAARVVAAGQAAETETAQAVAHLKALAVAQAVEVEQGQSITRPGAVPQAVEVEAGQPITVRKTRTVAQASETETAQAVAKAKTKAVAQAVEAEQAQTVSRPGAVSQAVETEAAQAVGRLKTKAASQSVEVEAAQAVTRVKTGAAAQAAETETAQAVTVRKTRTVAQAVEVEQAQTVSRLGHLFIAAGQAVETETALAMGRVKLRALAQAAEAEAATALTKRRAVGVVQALEGELAQAIAALGGVPPPRWVEAGAGAAGLVEGGAGSAGVVEGTIGV